MTFYLGSVFIEKLRFSIKTLPKRILKAGEKGRRSFETAAFFIDFIVGRT
jgi:hypothetical protein